MKIYTVFLYDIDKIETYSHFVGSFDSIENYQKALKEIELEFDIVLTREDYEVHETVLNKNSLIS